MEITIRTARKIERELHRRQAVLPTFSLDINLHDTNSGERLEHEYQTFTRQVNQHLVTSRIMHVVAADLRHLIAEANWNSGISHVMTDLAILNDRLAFEARYRNEVESAASNRRFGGIVVSTLDGAKNVMRGWLSDNAGDTSRHSAQFAIMYTGASSVSEIDATISKLKAQIAALQSKLEELNIAVKVKLTEDQVIFLREQELLA